MKTPKPIKTYTSADFARWGAQGGASASGDKKIRGNRNYYKQLSKLGVAKRKENVKPLGGCD